MKHKKLKKQKVKKNLKKADRKIKKEIHQAVEKIPDLIVEHIKSVESQPEQNLEPAYLTNGYSAEMKKKILWSAVIVLALIIFALWTWNMKNVFQGIKNTQTSNPLKGAKTNFQAIMKSATEENAVQGGTKGKEEQDIKDSLKQGLTALINSLSTTTTTSSNR